MSYIGTQQGTASPVLLDSITVVNGQAAYTMQKGGVNYSPASTLVMQVSLNGIIQAPNSSYTINGSTITFASALVTGDVIDYILVREPTTGTIAPVDGSVTDSKIVSMASSKLTGALPAIDGSALTGIDTELTATDTIPAEGGTATTVIVQGLAKCWVNFNGAAATLSPRDSFNTSSLTDVGTGQHKVLFTNNMNNAVYHGMATSGCNRNGNSYTCWTGIDITASGTNDTDAYTSKTTSEVQICNLDGGNSLEDSIDMNCILHGDLA